MDDLANTQDKFDFNGAKLEFILDGKYDPWFKAKVIAEILSYKRPKDVIDTLIPTKHEMTLEALLNQKCFTNHLSHVQEEAVFINESGLCTLISRSALPEIR